MRQPSRFRRAVPLLMVFALLSGGASIATASSPFDSPELAQARNLLALAEEAKEQGRYREAYRLAEEARLLSSRVLSEAEMLLLQHRASGYLKILTTRIRTIEEKSGASGASAVGPDPLAAAKRSLMTARERFDTRDWQASIEHSLTGLAALQSVAGVFLPRHYTVRLIPEHRDSLWKIAGYPFVYGNPWLWPELWEANRNILRDPENPHLIFPGQVLIIPSLMGEQRTGMYDPER